MLMYKREMFLLHHNSKISAGTKGHNLHYWVIIFFLSERFLQLHVAHVCKKKIFSCLNCSQAS